MGGKGTEYNNKNVNINKDFSYGLKLPNPNSSVLNASNIEESFDNDIMNITERP